jgi:hypothetical protein
LKAPRHPMCRLHFLVKFGIALLPAADRGNVYAGFGSGFAERRAIQTSRDDCFLLR